MRAWRGFPRPAVERESNATRRTMSGPTTDHTSERRDVNLQPVYVCCVNINGYMTWNAAIGPSGNPLEVPRKGILTTRFRCRARWIGCMPLHGMAPTPVPCAICHVPMARHMRIHGEVYCVMASGAHRCGPLTMDKRSMDCPVAVWRSGGLAASRLGQAAVHPWIPVHQAPSSRLSST